MRFAALILVAALTAPLMAEPVMKSYWVTESYAIVIGRLADATVTTKDSVDHGTGVVKIDRVLSAPAKLEPQYTFTWRHSPETARMCPPSFDFRQVAEHQAIWFLERRQDGSVRPYGEFWLIDNAESLDYHLMHLKTMDPASERVILLSGLLREQLERVQR